MSERPQPVPEPGFSHYWGWVSRQPTQEEVFRMVTTTPGLPDLTWMAENVEKATREMVRGRANFIRDILNGWELLEGTMNREIALALFNEFVAGCRTLSDFEIRNFSKKNKVGPRENFPSHLTGNPMCINAPVEDLNRWGFLPTTPFIYSNQCQEFFTPSATNMYYEMMFGDAETFFNILRENCRNPNQPPGIHPLPYHPGMNIPNYYEQFPGYSTFRPPPFPLYQQQPQMQPMPFVSQQQQHQQPMFYPVMQQPQFYPVGIPMAAGVPMQQPLQAMQNIYGGASYQQAQYQPYQPQNRNRGSNFRRGRGRQGDQQQHQQQGNGNSSSSSSTVKENPAINERELEPKETMDEAFPALVPQAAQAAAPCAKEPAVVEDVVAEPVVEMAPAEAAIPEPEPTSDAQEAETPAEVEVATNVASTSTVANAKAAPIAEDAPETQAVAEVVPVVAKETSTAEALVIDTAVQDTPVVPPLSQKTVAEVVQHSLSATPSPALTNRNGSTQPSPAVKPYATVVSPANGVLSHNSSDLTNTNTDGQSSSKGASKKRQPSVSYAQMLYGSPKAGPSSTSSRSSGSSSSIAPSQKPINQTSGRPDDWQTVKNKKTVEPVLVSPSTVDSKPVKTTSTEKPEEPVKDDSDDDDAVKSDDPDLEKKRERRRQKRQRIKEANKQQKQNEKEIARQESLARVDAMNAEAPRQQTPPLAFDRNNIAARRRKRQELQRRTEHGESSRPVSIPNPPTSDPPAIPVLPIRQVNGGPMSASIAAGQTAMAALNGIPGQFRRSSPFAIIAPNGSASIPLYLPQQLEESETDNSRIVEVPDETANAAGPKLSRQLKNTESVGEKTQIDENANMIERILMFDSLEKLSVLDMPESEKTTIAKGLDDIKKMYVRVEKAGQLISYKTGSSKVSQKTEEKLLTLTIKLLSNRVELSSVDDQTVAEISKKVAQVSTSFNYTNYLSALLDFSQSRATELPSGTNLRKNYEQTVVLTKVFLKRTKTIFEKIEKYYDFTTLED